MNKLRSFLLPFVVLALVAQSAYGAFYQWSKTAGSNATADPSINWAEGMAPSAVNDSARSMMARLKEWGDDISGMLAAGGTSTAYTVTSNQGLTTTPSDGTVICFTPGTTNAVGVTLAVDGGTAFPIRIDASNGVSAASLVSGSPYCAIFRTGSSGWIVRQFFGNPFNVPLGAILPCTCTTAPNSNFVIPAGQAISRTTFASYFAQVGTTYGVGDGVATFNVPDLTGRIIAGFQSPASRITTAGSGIDGAAMGAAGGAQNVTIAQANLPSVTLTTTISAGQGSHTHFVSSTPGGGFTGGGGGRTITTAGPDVVSTTTLPAMSGTTPLGGSGTATNKMPPTMILQYILRVF